MLTPERPPPLVEMETDCVEPAWRIVIEPLIAPEICRLMRPELTTPEAAPAALKLRSSHLPEILPLAWCRFDRISVL